LSCAGLAGAGALVLTARDLFSPDDKEGALRLMHLVSYNYKRPWPDSLDFSNTIAAATLAFVLASCLLALPRLRPHAVVLLLSLGAWVAAWGIDIYFVRTAPHWGQRETILEYYRRRAHPEEPLVAFQMNWKGENFYTGNRVAVFVSLNNKEMTEWLDKKKGVTAYFVLEHGRLARLKTTLGSRKVVPLTTDRDNNTFVLVKAKL
jgi:hypothetical protein